MCRIHTLLKRNIVNADLHKVRLCPNQELERSWREYDRLEGEVTATKNILLEQLEALGSPQVESSLRLKTLLLLLVCCLELNWYHRHSSELGRKLR